MSRDMVPKKKPAGIKEIDEAIHSFYASHVEFGGIMGLQGEDPFHPNHVGQVDAHLRMDLPMPECAVCGRTVDEVITMPRTGLETTYIVRCHGEEETVTLKDRDVLEANSVTVGKAFTNSPRRLNHEADHS